MAQNSLKSFTNQNSELKSHSSALTNERINALWAAYDTEILNAKNDEKLNSVSRAYNTIHILWDNSRCLVFNDPVCRDYLNLETQVDGVYKLDVLDEIIDEHIFKMRHNPKLYSYKNRRGVLKKVEHMARYIRNIFQYFKFYFRTDNRQKPDIFEAANTEFIPDENTINQLATVVGKRHKIDFEKYQHQFNSDTILPAVIEEDDEEEDEDEDYEED